MEQMNKKSNNVDMLDKIYDVRQEELQEESSMDRTILKNVLDLQHQWYLL